MHLLNIIALYASVVSILTLLFQYINVYFPDPLNPYFDAGSPIRWAIASLVIIFPVFLWTSRFLHKDIKQNPEKNELKIRRWLLYFTLFAAAVIIIGDLVALIYNFLEGELTVRFALKITSVLAVALNVFGYYLYNLRYKPAEFSPKIKIFSWSIIATVAVIVIAGVFIAGSPFKQRLVSFDRQKINDLQMIQGQIVNFWTQKARLPVNLNELKDSISGFAPPADPQTSEPYSYKETGKLSFELCAKFNLVSEEKQAYALRPAGPFGDAGESWNHQAGEFCFARVIDPELYRPKEKIL